MKRLLILLFVETIAGIGLAQPSGLPQNETGSYPYPSAEAEANYTATRYKGTIDGQPVILTLYDLEDALDGHGTMWAYSGNLTYTSSGEQFRIEGYIRRQYMFLDMYDKERKPAGRFELEGDVDGYRGTFSTPAGKEFQVKFIEE